MTQDLREGENVIGVISIYKLLVQKDAFTAVDYELFSLLAAHAATAIFSSKLYSQSERRLTTIQGFLDLLTAPTGKSPVGVAAAPTGDVWVVNQGDDTLTVFRAPRKPGAPRASP